MYRGQSQSMLIEAAEMARDLHVKYKLTPQSTNTTEVRGLIREWNQTIDSVRVISIDAMKVSHNPNECKDRLDQARQGMADMKEFMPLLTENENSEDFKQKLLALAYGAGEVSIDLFYASTITHDDLPPTDGSGQNKGKDAMADNANRAELDEAALNLLKEAYQRDLDAQGADGAAKADAAVNKVTELQVDMEGDIIKLMDALVPVDPLGEDEVDLTSDGDIIFNPEVAEELIYRIQIGYYKINRDPEHFHGLHPVYAFSTEEGYAKFYTGQYRSYRSAVGIKNYIKDNFIPDAFVVPFYGSKRISVSDAIFKELQVKEE